MLEISFFPTSARASSAASPEGPAFSDVFSLATLCSGEAPLVTSCSWVFEVSRVSDACPPHAAARSKMMPSRITTAGFFLMKLCSNSLLGLSALKGAAFLCSQAKVSTKLKILRIRRGCVRTPGPGATARGANLQGGTFGLILPIAAEIVVSVDRRHSH
jgi:hypothetical protein